MRRLEMAGHGREADRWGIRIAICCVVSVTVSPALFAQRPLPQPVRRVADVCPAGQKLYSTFIPTGAVQFAVVPGSAGGFPSGVLMKAGYHYNMYATGSIRVGVIGETGTPPDGWVPQGPAGAGFPAPDVPTFGLLFRVGAAGVWQYLGPGLAVAKLGPNDPAGTQIQFGINDNKLSDNSGLFNVVINEYAPGMKCESATPPSTGFIGGATQSSGGSSGGSATGPKLPCAGITSDGRMASFQFPMYCTGMPTRQVPEEACTRQDAFTQAQAQARSDGCILQSN